MTHQDLNNACFQGSPYYTGPEYKPELVMCDGCLIELTPEEAIKGLDEQGNPTGDVWCKKCHIENEKEELNQLIPHGTIN